MVTTNNNSVFTPNFVRDVFQDYILEPSGKYCISVGGKILTVNGKVCFDSHEQAMRAFYNSFHWRVLHKAYQINHPEQPYGWWRDPDRKQQWTQFKSYIKDNYDFKIVQI